MSEVMIRPLASLEEREACVALQEQVWGRDFADRVPASILLVAAETGGVVSGAFEDDRLVGFIFGITGYRGERPLHWSDMLAVAPGYRGRGIGLRLKLHQRDRLLAAGVDRVLWTFDPLEARNAHLNLHRLGATSREYRRDVYGASDSPLHAGIGTDRLVAEWSLPSERVVSRLRGEEPAPAAGEVPVGDAPVLNPPVREGDEVRPGATQIAPDADAVRIAIPADIQAVKREDLGLAVAWRANVRAALERALDAGYTVVDLERDDPVARYVLIRGLER